MTIPACKPKFEESYATVWTLQPCQTPPCWTTRLACPTIPLESWIPMTLCLSGPALLPMLRCECMFPDIVVGAFTTSPHSSVYLTISMQYASGPDYISHFLSFINSTVRFVIIPKQSTEAYMAHDFHTDYSLGSRYRAPLVYSRISETTLQMALRPSQTRSSSPQSTNVTSST